MSKMGNPRLKRPHVTSEYTPEMIQEMRRCATDPIYFIENYVYIKHPVRGKVKFNLYPYQREMIRNYQDEKLAISCLPRQSGKTETTAAYFLWFSIFHDEKTILIASNKSDSAKEIIGKILYAYEEIPEWLKPGLSTNNIYSLEFENGSRVMATTTTPDTGRGFAISILYCDEFAFVDIAEAFYTSIFPVISTGGKMFITSTPNGDVNLFAQIWRVALAGTNGYKPFTIKWSDVPGRTEQFKIDTIRAFGERTWLQEYECHFISSEKTLIDTMVINQIEETVKDRKVLFSIREQDFWKPMNKSMSYLVGVDVSEGIGSDYSVIQIFEFPTLEQVSEYRTDNTSPAELYGHLKNVLRYLEHQGDDIYFSVENNSLGQAIIALLEVDERPLEKAMFISESGKNKSGIATTGKSKIKSCLLLKEMVLKGTIKLVSMQLLRELKSFVRKAGSYEAQTGSTDDCIAATLIILRVLEEMAMYDDNAYHKLYTLGLEEADEMQDTGGDWGEEDDIDSMPMPMLF